MKHKVYFSLFVSFILTLIFIVIGIENHFFDKYVNNYLLNENICFELISSNSQNENEYIRNKPIDIREDVISILSWSTSTAVFRRGVEYPYFSFIITDYDSEPLFLRLILHHDKEALQIIFSNRRNHQINYAKHISSKAIIEDLLIKLTE
jgi:hypothetical protein